MRKIICKNRRVSDSIGINLLLMSIFILSMFCLAASCRQQKQQNRAAFFKVTIDPQAPTNPWAKMVSDIDRDGQNDIVIGGQNGPLVWYKAPAWRTFTIAESGYHTVDGECADVDGDGDTDVIMGGLLWYENPGTLQENPEALWNVHPVADHPTHDVEAADMDGDGDVDIAYAEMHQGADPDEVVVLLNRDNGHSWSKMIVSERGSHGLISADLNGDGIADLLGANWSSDYQPVEAWMTKMLSSEK